MRKKIIKIAQENMGSATLEAKSVRQLIVSVLNKLIQCFAATRLPIGSKNRCRLERLRGVRIGKNVFFSGGNILDRVRPDLITIEDSVSIAGNVIILTHSNPTTPIKHLIGDAFTIIAPVVIKRGAWIAINSIILPGVTIGECSIVSAGSVVHDDVPPYAIVSGVPATIRKIYYKKQE